MRDVRTVSGDVVGSFLARSPTQTPMSNGIPLLFDEGVTPTCYHLVLVLLSIRIVDQHSPLLAHFESLESVPHVTARNSPEETGISRSWGRETPFHQPSRIYRALGQAQHTTPRLSQTRKNKPEKIPDTALSTCSRLRPIGTSIGK